MKKVYQTKFQGYPLIIEINDLAARSSASVFARWGDTSILTSVVIGEEEKPELDFLPLTVEYEERFYAAGKIYGSRFIRRETRPSVFAILNARLIDRAIRPCFPKWFKKPIQVNNLVVSFAPENLPEVPALISTSIALMITNLPFQGPVGIGQLKEDNFELTITVSEGLINMIEFTGQEFEEKKVIELIKKAFQLAEKTIAFQREIVKEFKLTKEQEQFFDLKQQVRNWLAKTFKEKDLEKNLFENLTEGESVKKEIKDLIFELAEEKLTEDERKFLPSLFEEKLREVFHSKILSKKIRPDGRKLTEMRPLEMAINIVPRVHGSSIFKRGLTHIFSVVTLGSPGEEMLVRDIEYEGGKKFIHHYNFPRFSVGELGQSRGPSRREIGHGALVEKAISPLLPSQDEFPYTIRVVSEVLSSNGSTSMGSVCASSLALFSAGVPLKTHVAGISIGLVSEENLKNYLLMTDIQGPEDHYGDMDFKVAGTSKGITAIQLDVKIPGLNFELIEQTFDQAKIAREKIIEKMNQTISKPQQISAYAPKVIALEVPPEKFGLVIGPGGRMINEIIAKTEAKIDLFPEGIIYVSGDDLEKVKKAVEMIKNITKEYKVGDLVTGKVIKILDFGAIIELAPGQTALLHISEIAPERIKNIRDYIQMGEVLPLKIKAISPEGKINVSLKDARRKNK